MKTDTENLRCEIIKKAINLHDADVHQSSFKWHQNIWHFSRATFAFLKHQNIFIFKEGPFLRPFKILFIMVWYLSAQLLWEVKTAKLNASKVTSTSKMQNLIPANIYGFMVRV